MSFTATNKTGWIFDGLTPSIEFREDPEDATKEQKRESVIYRRKQKGQGAVNFTSEQGSTATASTIYSNLSASDTNKAPSVPSGLTKMLCIKDSLEKVRDGSGIVLRVQEWTAYTDWEAFDAETELA